MNLSAPINTFATTSRNAYLLSSIAVVAYQLESKFPDLHLPGWYSVATLLASVTIGVASLIQLSPHLADTHSESLSWRMQWYALALYLTALVSAGGILWERRGSP
jgi:cytochrome oxidase assembly protein ShyY1